MFHFLSSYESLHVFTTQLLSPKLLRNPTQVPLHNMEPVIHSSSPTICTALPQKGGDRNVQMVNISFVSDECMKLSLDCAQLFPVPTANSSSLPELGCCQASHHLSDTSSDLLGFLSLRRHSSSAFFLQTDTTQCTGNRIFKFTFCLEFILPQQKPSYSRKGDH